ncbi:MAG: hypothetical protein NXH75_18475, partial [Halobacteriovoraceae bacterium]|nr:hypothetical protein [Halobacteriovoraceae bacterium]
NFNAAELQDIMNEIESLEKEFQEEAVPETQAAETTAEETYVEETVAEETPVEETANEEPVAEATSEEEAEDAELVSEAEEYEEPANNVVAMPQRSAGSGSEGYMEFSGQGNMDLNLSIPVGSETATVNVTSDGLKVTMAGVELHLSETGCEVEMNGGVKFSVPLTGEAQKGKKAA